MTQSIPSAGDHRATLTRRTFLIRSGLLGCSAAASPLLTPITFAATPGDNRLVVIILRGAMDGLDVVQPYGDPALAGLRRSLRSGPDAGAHDLDGFYALHPGLGALLPLWQAGELAFGHAVSTPYRDKRSHFDGQDLLEAGTSDLAPASARDGWLNRLLQQQGITGAETAYAIGRDALPVLAGRAPVANWAPDAGLLISPQARRLAEAVMHDDPLFRMALSEALQLSRMDIPDLTDDDTDTDSMAAMAPARSMGQPQAGGSVAGHVAIADFAAERLRGAARIAAFSLNGWDTHMAQAAVLPGVLAQLAETVLALRDGLGPVWVQTAVLAVTEFGRTARENGTAGTDHGTGGAMLMAGGAIRGGRVLADWPGLGADALYDGRDLRPTRDVRDVVAWAMRGLFGLDRSVLETAVFPGLDMGADPRIIL